MLASIRKYSPKQRPNTMVWNLARLSGSDITSIISVCITTHRDVGELHQLLVFASLPTVMSVNMAYCLQYETA